MRRTHPERQQDCHDITTDDPLVSTDWLAAHLDDPHVKIIDASFKMPGVLPLPSDDYLAAHIPGAVFFNVDAIADHGRSAAAHVSGRRAVCARRVGARHLLGRYRGGLRCRRLGRRAPGVVDVPVVRPSQCESARWRPEEVDAPRGARSVPARSRRNPGNSRPSSTQRYVRSKQQLLANLQTKTEQLVDARPRARFEGSVAEPRPGRRSGHIPGSRNVPYAELFDAKTGAMKPLDELRKAFTGAGVDMTQTDRDDLRFRRLRAGVDARALSARRARHRALRRLLGRMGPARRAAGRDRSGLILTQRFRAK